MTKRSSTGLLAAAFTAIVPSYISRSVGGSYDNEGVAIFALIFVFYLWIKSVNTGSMMWACLTVRGRAYGRAGASRDGEKTVFLYYTCPFFFCVRRSV